MVDLTGASWNEISQNAIFRSGDDSVIKAV